MTNELKIDFINITLDSFNNGNFNYEKVENIIIEYCNCNYDKLDLNKLLKFKNLQTLSIIPGEKDYEEYYISIYLAPLLKFSSLSRL